MMMMMLLLLLMLCHAAQGGNYGPASYMWGNYGPSWGYGRFYGGYVRYPTIPDPVRMDTSTERRFAMIS
jgi:hypothetical protein